MIIVNADDWGRSPAETDAAAACHRSGGITSVTAMVYMEDSQRAAEIANEMGIEVGLHLNLTQPFSARGASETVTKQHREIAAFLTSSRHAGVLYRPRLRSAFRDVCQAQLGEFVRLYGRQPSHIDGHHHQHLCTNMLLGGIFAKGTKVRPSFHFSAGEKPLSNRAYRYLVNALLRRRYRVADYFFALSQCVATERIGCVFGLATTSTVELMTHPVVPSERQFLMSEEYMRQLACVRKGTYSLL